MKGEEFRLLDGEDLGPKVLETKVLGPLRPPKWDMCMNCWGTGDNPLGQCCLSCGGLGFIRPILPWKGNNDTET